MKDCCDTNACITEPTAKALCPGCKETGRPVEERTIRAMVNASHADALLGGDSQFCRTPGCDVLYFTATGDIAVPKSAARVRVGLKEISDPIPLCYCFGFTRADVVREVDATGGSTIPQRITAEVRAGSCACEEKNPAGRCCLGDVRKAVVDAVAARSQKTAALAEGGEE